MTQRKQEKRLAASRRKNLLRKKYVWIVKANPGAHKSIDSVPLLMLIRDYLKLANNASEAKDIIRTGKINVDGKVVKEPKHAVGFMDIIEIPEMKKKYLILFDEKGRLVARENNEKENTKLARVEKITQTSKGKQITLHDGRNIITKDAIKIGDVLKIEVPSQKIVEHFSLKEGNTGYITSGKHAGLVSKIKGIIPGNITRSKQVIFEKDGQEFTTRSDYIFVVGKDKPVISIEG